MRSIPLFLALLALVTGCGGIETEVDSASSGILNGTPDNTAAHMAVVGLSFGGGGCSGTLISRDVVLTAGHCAYGQSAGAYTVSFGDDWYSPDHTRGVSEVWVHPGYNDANITHDVALLRLSSEAPASITPIPYLPNNLGITNSDVGVNLEFVGFGTTETGNSGYKLTTDNQRPEPRRDLLRRQRRAGLRGQKQPGVRGRHRLLRGQQQLRRIRLPRQGRRVRNRDPRLRRRDPRGPLHRGLGVRFGLLRRRGVLRVRLHRHLHDLRLAGQSRPVPGGPNATPCPDPDACNGTEVCLLGECVAGQPLDCDDDNSCTTDSCDPAAGCVYTSSGEPTWTMRPRA